ncbi:MAG TPA: hypothetical protein VFI52_01425 [Gemmatimonadaceae bacterium]|nr:hypothetical protein [Gemmatimonadaceae bacterium]
MRRGWGFRGWAIVWAVLQFALPTVATFADARLERESVTARGSHVESRSDASCHRVHPTECALCQVVSRVSAPTVHSDSCPAIVNVVEQVVIAERPWRALTGSARLALARAPPLT